MKTNKRYRLKERWPGLHDGEWAIVRDFPTHDQAREASLASQAPVKSIETIEQKDEE